MARILPGVPVGEYRTVSVLCLAMSRYVAPPARVIPGVRVIFPEYRAASGSCGA
jgi:hypothetical protein